MKGNIEIRKLIESDRETRIKLMRYAFQTSKNSYDNLVMDKEPMDWYYGAFEYDTMVATAGMIPFDIRMRSRDFKMYGIGGVASKPEYRNRGIIREIMVEMFRDMYEKKIPLSVLYPFKHSFYERLGYRLVDEHLFYQFRISDIIYQETNYHMKEVVRIDDEIRKVYDTAVQHFDYIAKRPLIEYWRALYKGNYKFICYNGNEPVGYIIINFGNAGERWFKSPEKTIIIRETFWLNQEAKQTIFNFLWSHRDQRKYVAGALPINENVIDFLKTPRILRRNIIDNSLLRVIDVKAILENLEYPISDFVISFQVHDEFCPWNNGFFILTSKEDKISVEYQKTMKVSIDIEIDIGYFSQLVAGFRTVKNLFQFGFITAKKEKLELLHDLFPKTNNYLHDFF
ncbi:MAG: GNAT family N-acetyltransferase [Promethearchaeota archaeon]|jgi:predicted acetyltransferase